MKKTLISLIAAITLIISILTLTACSSSVTGKKYVFEDVEVAWGEDVDSASILSSKGKTESEYFEQLRGDLIGNGLTGYTYTFTEDGKMITANSNGLLNTSFYSQTDNTVNFFTDASLTKPSNVDDAMTVDGRRISYSQSNLADTGVVFTFIFIED